MSHKRIIGQKLSAYRQFVTVSFKSNLKIIILNAIIMLVFATWFLIGTLNSHIKDNADFLMQLFMFSISFTIATEIKDWNEYHVDKIGLKNCKLGTKVIYYIPAFSISLLLFNTLLTIGIITKDNFHTDWINTLSVLILISFIISYSIRQIKFKYDEYYKEINKKNI